MPRCQVEIVFPLAGVKDQPEQGWFIDGGSNQSYTAGPTGGTVAPGALPHQIGTDTLVPYVPPPTPPTCLASFAWGSSYIANNSWGVIGQDASPVDQFGNFYVQTNARAVVFNGTTGAEISSLNQGNLADLIDAWNGSAVVGRGAGFNTNNGFQYWPLLQGQYILAYFVGSDAPDTSFAKWFTILQPNPTGDPTVLGAIWFEAFEPFRFNPFVTPQLANNQTVNDPILLRANNDNSGATAILGIIPSINDIATGIYKLSGFGLGYTRPCQVPLVYYSSIGNADLSANLYIETTGLNQNLYGGFALPGASNTTNYYMYFNRTLMDFEAPGGTNRDPELTNVITPAYPHGAMVKIALGHIDYITVATVAAGTSGVLGSTPMYTIDNTNWVDEASIVQIPFQDEYTFLSDGTSGGNDVYAPQPGTVIDRGDGTFWVLLYMPGLSDATDNTSGTLYESIRIFSYSPATGVATQFLRHICPVYTAANISWTSEGVGDCTQSHRIIGNGNGSYTDIIFGIRNDNLIDSRVYRSDFCQFTP